MGKRGPIAKAEPQGHRSNLTILPGGGLAGDPPRAPKGLLDSTRKEWREFWRSSRAAFIDESSYHLVVRLFTYRDKWKRAMAVVEGAMAVKGSMGQVRTNPLFDTALKLEDKITKLEDSLGLSPMAAARLGMSTANTMESLARMNAAFEDPEPEEERDVVDVDPRLAALVESDSDG